LSYGVARKFTFFYVMKKIKNIILAGSNGLPMLVDIFFKDDPGKKPTIVYAHGFNGFKDWGNFDIIAEKFAAAGFVFVKFNFSHNGTSIQQPAEFENLDAFGQNNYTKQLNDLKIITNWLCDPENIYSQSINSDNIILLGHSLGAGISVLFSAEDARIKKLVTWASVHECKTPWGNWSQEKIALWQKSGVEY
jgi:predicted dienelactone hydrolase